MASFARGNPARWWKGRSCGAASRAPKSLFISPLRRWAGVISLLMLVLFLGGVWYLTNPARISRMSEALLSRVLGGNVSVRTGRLSLSGTLLLSGVEVRTADAEPTPASEIPIFSADAIEARFDWFSLLSGQLSATQLVATKPVFRPIEDLETHRWNYERLRPGLGDGTPRQPSSTKGLTLPVVVVKDARVRRGEVRQGRVLETGEIILNGELTPDALLPTVYHMRFDEAQASGEAPVRDIGLALKGTWDSVGNSFTASADNVMMNDTLRNILSREAREWCDEHHLTGRLSQVNFSYNGRVAELAISLDGVSMMTMIDPQQGIGVSEDRPSYPMGVGDVRGKVFFTLTPPANAEEKPQTVIRIENLTGEVLGYRFAVDSGEIQGTSQYAPYDIRVRFPGAVLKEQYPPVFMALLLSQDLLQRVQPHGKMDIAMHIMRTEKGDVEYDGTIDCHDVMMRFAHFPYPMDHLNGRISFTRQTCTFHDLVGKADINDVKITGTTGIVLSNRMIDFTITSDNVCFDDRLAACLPQKFKDIWDSFEVSGHGKLVCRVMRANSILAQPKIVVDVEVDEGGGFIRTVPYAFTGAKGRLHFEADETRIEHLSARTGADGSGRIELNGTVRHAGGDVIYLRPELKVVADVPIDDRLRQAFPEEWTDKLRKYTLGGRLDFDGTLRRSEEEGHAVLATGTVGWRNGAFKGELEGQAVAFSGIMAKAQVSPTKIDLLSFGAAMELPGLSKVEMTVAGKLEVPGMSGVLQFTAAGKELALPAGAPMWLPAGAAEQWAAYSPRGKVDLDARATIELNLPKDGGSGGGQPLLRVSDAMAIASYGGLLKLHDVALMNEAWPDALAKLNGTVEVIPGKINMTGMSAEMGGVSLQWQGAIKPETGWVALSGDAVAKGLPEKWLSHLPASIRERLDLKQEGTTVALHLDSLARPENGKPWVFEGKLESEKLGLIGGFPMMIESATTAGKGTWDASKEGGFDFTGTLDAKNIAVSNHLLDTFQAGVNVAGEKHLIDIANITGKVAEGTLQGEIQFRTAGGAATQAAVTTAPGTMPSEGGYLANLVLSDADLPRLLLSANATDEERRKVGTGRVTASLSLQQTFGPQGDRTGRGDLVVANANIYDVPLSMGLMQIVTLRLPIAHSFQHATMSYYLRNDQITFEKILLESSGVNLAGTGTVTLSDRALNMSFITATPNMDIPIISAFQRELLEVSVTGTAGNPKVTPVPLSPVANILRAFLPQQVNANH